MMVQPLPASAGTPVQHTIPVLENERLAERTYRLRLADAEIARRIRPGQFVMLRAPGITDPLLARPFALYDTFLDERGEPAGYDIVYLVIGKMTTLMSGLKPGDPLEVWGPLGNGFSLTPCRRLLMVAGGIGQTPFPAVARAYLGLRGYGATSVVSCQSSVASGQPTADNGPLTTDPSPITDHRSPSPRPVAKSVSLHYGVRSARFAASIEDFERLGVRVSLATDDGSAGHHGFVTDLVERALCSADPPDRILGCGPEPMMKKLAETAARHAVPCELSLETPMACGIGICFSCVARIRQGEGSWDYRRVCVEGPVFGAASVVF